MISDKLRGLISEAFLEALEERFEKEYLEKIIKERVHELFKYNWGNNNEFVRLLNDESMRKFVGLYVEKNFDELSKHVNLDKFISNVNLHVSKQFMDKI